MTNIDWSYFKLNVDGTPRKPGEEDRTCSGHLVSEKKSDLLRMYNLCVL